MAESAQSEVNFHRLADGRRLAWRQMGQGPPLVMLHGWSMSGVVFQEVAAVLSSDFQVLCPDLCGHGWSDPADNYTLELLASDIAHWVAALSLPSPALLGWSLGGQIAMQLASDPNLFFRRLLLISTTPCFCQKESWSHGLPPTQLRTMRRQLQRAYLKTLGEFFDLQFVDETFSKERRSELLSFADRSSLLPEPEDCLSVLNILASEDQREMLSELGCPVLVMHGTLDRIVPCGAGRYLAEEIAGAQLHLMDGVGHAPFMSRPQECAMIWRDFLK